MLSVDAEMGDIHLGNFINGHGRRWAVVATECGSQSPLLTLHRSGRSGAFGVGRVVSTHDARRMLKLLAGDESPSTDDVLPANTVACSPEITAWVVPGTRRRMWFRYPDTLCHVDAMWPNLLIVAQDGSLHIAATKEAHYTGPAQALYHAPLMNIYSSGKVCLPQGISPIRAGLDGMGNAESVVFDTAFAHANHDTPIRCRSTSREAVNARLFQAAQDASRAGVRKWNAKTLVDMGMSVSQFVEHCRGA